MGLSGVRLYTVQGAQYTTALALAKALQQAGTLLRYRMVRMCKQLNWQEVIKGIYVTKYFGRRS